MKEYIWRFYLIILFSLLTGGCSNPHESANNNDLSEDMLAAAVYVASAKVLSDIGTQSSNMKAYDHYSKAINLNPDMPSYYLERGMISYGLGNDYHASSDFDIWMFLSNNNDENFELNPYTYFIVADTFYNTGKKEKSIKLYEIYLEQIEYVSELSDIDRSQVEEARSKLKILKSEN